MGFYKNHRFSDTIFRITKIIRGEKKNKKRKKYVNFIIICGKFVGSKEIE